MSQIGTLITGAGVQTPFAGQAQLDKFIVIGDFDTAVPISGLSIEVDGKPFINISGVQTLLAAWAKWRNRGVLQATPVVGMAFVVSSGRIPRNTTYRFTNGGATTPAVFVFSDADNGIPVEAATNQINASSKQMYKKFSALFVQTPANVSNFEVIFNNGYSVTLTVAELAAYFGMQYDSETDAQLGGVLAIDNSDQKFRQITINVTTAVNILTVRVPQESWDILTEGM
jgi:hypothetical protein